MPDSIYDDGGRKQARFKGEAGDCVARAIAIAADLPYAEVYNAVNLHCARDTWNRRRPYAKGSARTGVPKSAWKEYLTLLGWYSTPTMRIGSGCRVHLRADELPMGRLIVQVSRHLVAVIDGVIHDTYDCSRDGQRCVYAYWQKRETA